MSNYYDQASLVLVPSGYKDQKLYSQKPQTTAGQFLFNRGSDLEVTRVNSQGKIEKAILNGLLQSNTFSTTWTSINATVTGGQAGYDGTNNAWKLESTTAGVSASVRQFIAINGVSTYSVYAKAGNVNFITLYCASSVTPFNAWFNLSTGAVATTANDIDASITSVGGGWYRVTLTGLNLNQRVDIYPANADGSYITAVGEYIYIQDAQLNYGLVAQTYVETTTAAVISGLKLDTPRLNYDPANPTCPSLLLEPSRTNLIPSSEYLSFSGYTLRTISVTENYAISPEGVQNASLLTPSGSDAAILENISVTSGTTYAMSVWLKSATGSNVSTTIALGSAGFPESEGDGGKYKNITVTTEWQRFSIVSTADASVGTDISIGGFSGLATGENILAYGWQFEAGSYATSYIPTYGSSATRNGELALGGNVNIFNSSEGTLFLDFKAFKDDTSFRYIALSDGTVSNRVTITLDSQYRIQSAVSVGGVTQSNVIKQMSSASLSEGFKIAMTYKNNEFKSFVNGVETTPRDTSGNTFPVGTLKYLRLNQGNTTSNPLYGNVNKILVFNTALSDTELATLTSL